MVQHPLWFAPEGSVWKDIVQHNVPFQIIRVQSADGTKRVEVKPTDTTKTLYEKVYEIHNLSSYDFALTTSRDIKSEIASSNRKTLKGYKLNHGDMLFLHKLDPEGETVGLGLGLSFSDT